MKESKKKHFKQFLIGIVLGLGCISILFGVFSGLIPGFQVEKHTSKDIDKKIKNVGDPEPYSYWYAPNGSFGIKQYLIWNMSWLKNKIKNNIDWKLETNTGGGWYDNSGKLSIGLKWNRTGFYKIWFNVTNLEFGNHRITFGFNKQIKNMINKTDTEIWFDYEIENETLNLMFNYSDLLGKGLIFSKGIKNGLFWFRMRKNDFQGSYSFDPQFGQSTGGDTWDPIKDVIMGSVFTNTAGDGQVDNITAHVDLYGGSEKFKYAIYKNSTDNLVGTSLEGSGQVSNTHYTLNANGTFYVENNTEYFLCAWGTSGDGASIREIQATGFKRYDDTSQNYNTKAGTYDSSLSGQLVNEVPSEHVIYVQFTQNASGGLSWTVISSDKNGSWINTTTYQLISNDKNGSWTNTTIWELISNNKNGSWINTSAWYIISNNKNGSWFNTTTWNLISNNKNGSWVNDTGVGLNWVLISNNKNGSWTNNSWTIVSNDKNGSWTNTTIVWFTITGVYPGNNTRNVPLQPWALAIITYLGTETSFNVSWYNSSGLIQTDTNLANGTHNELFINATIRSTDYVLWIRCDDGTNWENQSFNFTTEGLPGGGTNTPSYMIPLAMSSFAFMFGLLIFIRFRRKRKYA